MKPRPSTLRPVPPLVFVRAQGSTVTALGKHYRAGSPTVERWIAETNAPVAKGPPTPAPRAVPDDFATLAPTMNKHDLTKHYRCHHHRVMRWLAETGVKAKGYDNRAPKPGHSKPGCYHKLPLAVKRTYAAANHLPRDASIEGQAADVLRRLTFVFRCTETGRADQDGAWWRFGNVVLSGEDLIERAKRKGWNPDAWMEVAA